MSGEKNVSDGASRAIAPNSVGIRFCQILFIAALIVPGTVKNTSPAFAQDSFADAFWQYRASTGLDVSSGFYGADERTTVVYVPATLQADEAAQVTPAHGSSARQYALSQPSAGGSCHSSKPPQLTARTRVWYEQA